MTLLVIFTLVIFGVVAYTQLPVSDLPAVDYPVMTISVSYPGASPELMASAVASPLENQCMQIPGLETLISSNRPGTTSITLGFELNKNVDLLAPDVQAAIQRATGDLPTDLPQPPTYDKTNPSDQPIIYIMLYSDTMTGGDLYDYGNTMVAQRINMLEGISKVDIYGSQRALRVRINVQKLSALGLSFNDVLRALGTGTVMIPGGDLNGPYRTFSLEPKGQLITPSEYENLVISYRDGAPVRISDVGDVIDSLENDLVQVMYGGPETGIKSGYICVAATKSQGANAVSLSKKIRLLLDEIKPTLPGSIDIDIFYDRAIQIKASIDDVKQTIGIALILVILVIFLFLGRVSDTMVPAMVLPVTLFGTFLVMMFAGFSLDNLSLMALTLSIGFLVDDAIVVLENTVRYIQQGKKPLEAAIVSMEEISGTVISTSLALITVFIPLVFMGGVIGKNFKEFALVVIFAIGVSTLMALTLSPMMCARILKGGSEKDKPRLERFIEHFFKKVVARYGRMLDWFLRRKFLAILGWLACLAGIAYFFTALPKSFMPIGDSGVFFGQMVALQGTSTDQIRHFQDEVNKIINSHQDIERLLTVTGTNPGSDQSTGMIVGTLKKDRKASTIEMVGILSRQMQEISNLGMVFMMPEPSLVLASGAESTATGSKYSYVLSGQDKELVYRAAFELAGRMEKSGYFSGVQNSVKLNMPQLDITLKRDRASALGITASDIETALALYYAKGKATTYLTDIQQYWIILQAGDQYRKAPWDLSQVHLTSDTTDKLIPLSSVADWKIGVGAQDVPHDSRLNAATISYNLAPGAVLGEATKELGGMLEDILSPAVGGKAQGEAQEFEDAVKSLAVLLVVAVFIMYVILGILYESYIHPFTVLTTLPPAAFGGLFILYLTGSELSIYAYIGLFMLLGIVSKNGIMMVDFAKEYMEEKGLDPYHAILEACKSRFRPILMTSASTIMGTLPIALGYGSDGASRQALGLVIAWGLLFAQVVTLFITPGIFLYMQLLQEKFFDRFELTRSTAARSAKEEDSN